MRFLKWLILGLAGVSAALLLALYVADPVITTRLVALPFGGGTGPLEAVPGGGVRTLPVASEANRSIAPAALEAAIAYGAEQDSHALLVYHGGALQLEHYYPGYTAETRTSTQSMHKSVLAMLVGIAIRDGHIGSVDDTAATYLPEWAGDGRAAITLRQMLRQESGIDFPTFSPNVVSGFWQMTVGGDIAPITLGQPLLAEPGSQFDYNSINPEALGIILQRATGQRYAAYLSEALWQPLGATEAAVVLDSEAHAVPRTFCCLEATARSWLLLGLLHLDQGRVGNAQVVPEAWMREIATPGTHNPNYGYLTWLGNRYEEYRYYNRKTNVNVYQSEPFAAPDVIYFDGFGGQRVYAAPSAGLVIVRTGAAAFDWDESRLPNLILRGIRDTEGTT